MRIFAIWIPPVLESPREMDETVLRRPLAADGKERRTPPAHPVPAAEHNNTCTQLLPMTG